MLVVPSCTIFEISGDSEYIHCYSCSVVAIMELPNYTIHLESLLTDGLKFLLCLDLFATKYCTSTRVQKM